MTESRPAVLFMCVHNAGRSQMAAGFLRHLARDTVDVYSGGSSPGTELNAMAVKAMAEVGIDISSASPQLWTDAVVRTADVIVSMGCGDVCPNRARRDRRPARAYAPVAPGPAALRTQRVAAVRMSGRVRPAAPWRGARWAEPRTPRDG